MSTTDAPEQMTEDVPDDGAPAAPTGRRRLDAIRNLLLAGLLGGAVGAGIVLLARPAPPANIVSVICGSTSKDAPNLNSAIRGSRPGDEILITGQCDLTSPVVLLGSRVYQGGSETGTSLFTERPLPYVVASDSYARNLASAGDPFTLRDLTINCNGAAVGLIARTAQVDVEHVEIDGCVTAGLEDTNLDAAAKPEKGASSFGVFRSLFIENCGEGFLVQDSGDSVTDSVLDDSVISSSTHTGIDLGNSNGWVIDGNHLFADGGDAIAASRKFATRISNNYIEDFAFGGGVADGIAAAVEPGTVSEIIDNQIFNLSKGTGDYIFVDVDSGTARVAVTGNEIIGNGAGVGLAYQAGGNALVVTSAANGVADVAQISSHSKGVVLVPTS
jgi:hypothetical protein